MKLLIRADASLTIGTGHVMRCLALAQEWHRIGGDAQFVQSRTTPELTQKLERQGINIRNINAIAGSLDDANQTIKIVEAIGACWVVADGYCFGSEWQKRIKSHSIRLMVLDDYGHADYYHADVVLNQNLSANERFYQNRTSLTRLLLGTRYTLLRHEFLKWRGFQRGIPAKAQKILLTMGGCDAGNVTGKVIKVLSSLPQVESVVVVGGGNPHLEWLKSFACGRESIRLVVNSNNMPELMAWADMAISAAGSTSWELAFMGLPSLILVVADNQAEAAEALARESVAINMGWYSNLADADFVDKISAMIHDAGMRSALSSSGSRLVDGLGAQRVAEALC